MDTVDRRCLGPVAGNGERGRFWRILRKNLRRLIQLNLLDLLVCLPVVTAPAAAAARSRITLAMWEERHFFWSDFWDTFRHCFQKASLAGILIYGGCGAAAAGFWFYRELTARTAAFWIPAWICAAACLLLSLMGAYVFLMIAEMDLPLKAVFQNAWRLVFLRLPSNLLLLPAAGGISAVCFLFFPASLPLVLFLASSLRSLAETAVAWPGIQRYVCGGSTGEHGPEKQRLQGKAGGGC